MLRVLRALVEINSFTANKSGVDRNADLVRPLFEPLGFAASRVKAEPLYADHLVLHRGSGKKFVLISHLDTVYAPEEEFAWREEPGKIVGPGVADIKGGTVVIWSVLQALRERHPRFFDGHAWTILLNSAEERGNKTFADLARAQVAGAAACLVYEPGYPRNTVVVSRKGSARFTLRIKGRPAHSGSHHERGASAVVELADKILKIAGLTDYSLGVTTNVGAIRGGTVVNTVPGSAEALIDLRARDPASFESTKQKIRSIAREVTVRAAADGFPCSMELEEHPDYFPMPRNPETDRLFNLAQACDPGIEPQDRGGASDACHVWNLVPTLDGLGPVGDHTHAAGEEFITPESLTQRARLSFDLLQKI